MEESKKPALRFKGFHDDWEQRKLSDVCSEIGDGLHSAPVYDENGKYYFINGNNLVNSKIIVNETETKRVSEETFKKNNKNLDDTTILLSINGTIGNLAYYNDEMVMLGKSAAYLKVMNIEKKFLYTSLQTSNTINSFMSSLTGTTIKNLGLEAIKKTQIFMPCEKEQTAIGKYFQNLDNLITLHQRKYESLVNIKKAMLEKMFPKNEEVVPELRFAGFTDTWEQRKLGEIADYKKGPFGSALKKEIFIPKSENSVKVYEQQNAIGKNWKLERYFITKEYANELKAFETHGGDILVSCAGTIGEMYELPDNSEVGVINQALMRVRVNEKIISKELYKLLFTNMIDDFSKEHSNGSAMKNIPPFADLKAMNVMLPTLDEQERIGAYFNKLDHLITLHQRELEKLQNIKKSCLEKMFI